MGGIETTKSQNPQALHKDNQVVFQGMANKMMDKKTGFPNDDSQEIAESQPVRSSQHSHSRKYSMELPHSIYQGNHGRKPVEKQTIRVVKNQIQI